MSGRSVLAWLTLAGLLGLAACARPDISGDAKGGIIEWFANTKGQVEDSASAHCARYGKTSRIIDLKSDRSGGHAIFSCQ